MNILSSMMFEAVIFDMDGVLLDSYDLWKEENMSLLDELGIDVTDELYTHFHGSSLRGVHALLTEKKGYSHSYETFSAERIERVTAFVYQHAPLIPGAKEFLAQISKLYSTALGSAAERQWVEMAISQHSLEDYFMTLVSATDVQGKGKPNPDIFLLAAKNMGIAPEKCLVIEDAGNGVLAAKRAGMYVAGFRNGKNFDQDFTLADIIFSDFSELNVSNILRQI